MIKAFVLISAILVSICPAYEALLCYNCYTLVSKSGIYDYKMNMCNEQNMTASDTLVCPSEKSRCIYEVLENEHLQGRQIWRTCSNPEYEPCDPKSAPSGLQMVKCSFCGTDRCNLYDKKVEKNTFTLSINANVSVSIEE